MVGSKKAGILTFTEIYKLSILILGLRIQV